MKCKNCEREIEKRSKFCPYCGAPVTYPWWNVLGIAVVPAIILLIVFFARDPILNKDKYIVGKNIVEVGGIFANDAGAINYKFKGADIYEMETDPDGKIAVFEYEENIYFVDSDLKINLIDSGCYDFSMNYTGEYVYIVSSEGSEFGSGLCVYDVARKQYRLVKKCDVSYHYNKSIVSSPDGNLVLISRDDGLFIMGLDGEEQRIESDSYFETLAISNDRRVAYFGNGFDGIICWTPEKIKDVSSDFSGLAAVDSECKKIIFDVSGDYLTRELHYFDSETMDRSKKIASNFNSLYLNGEECLFSRGAYYYPNAESFEGVIVNIDERLCWLNADMVIVYIGDVYEHIFSRDESKTYFIEENGIVCATYKGVKRQLDKIYYTDAVIESFTVSDDNSSLWIAFDNKIVKYKDGVEKEVFVVNDDHFGNESIINDPLTDKIYCITAYGNVYLLDEDNGAVLMKKIRKGDYLRFKDNLGKPKIIITSEDGEHHDCILFGNIINVD